MSLSTLTVRPRMPSDGTFIGSLSEEAFAAFSSYPVRAVRRMMFETGARSFVAELDGEPAALAVMSTETVAAGTVARLDAIAVAAHARRRGVGRRLLDHVIAEATRQGAMSIFLMTATANIAARHLFEQAGFLAAATQAAAYRRGQRAVLMFRPL